MGEYTVAVVGATGAVGRMMISVLEERNFPVRELRLFASPKSKGLTVPFKGEEIEVEVLEETKSFKGIDIALFSAGGSRSLEYAPKFAEDGAIVIDNSSAWRMDPEVYLVVPEVNPHAISQYKKKGIIANPNCSTIQMVVALKPLHDVAKIKRIVVSTYQSVSEAGKRLLRSLWLKLELGVQVKPFHHLRIFPKLSPLIVFLRLMSFCPIDIQKKKLRWLKRLKRLWKIQ